MVVFGAIGYLMKKFGFEPGPLVLAFVLGSLLEANLRRSLLVLNGDLGGFFGRPISATLLVLFVFVAVLPESVRTHLRDGISTVPVLDALHRAQVLGAVGPSVSTA